MKPWPSIVPLALALALPLFCGGCVMVRAVTAPGSDLARHRSFAFAPAADADQESFSRSPTGQVIRRQVVRALTERGLVQNDAQPDFLVAYYYVVETDNMAPFAAPFGPLYLAAPGTSRYLRGTLVVDLIDAGTRNTFWRGTARSLESHPENPKPPKIAAAVDKLMRRYPSMAPPVTAMRSQSLR
jgi:hypothetical protein